MQVGTKVETTISGIAGRLKAIDLLKVGYRATIQEHVQLHGRTCECPAREHMRKYYARLFGRVSF